MKITDVERNDYEYTIRRLQIIFKKFKFKKSKNDRYIIIDMDYDMLVYEYDYEKTPNDNYLVVEQIIDEEVLSYIRSDIE